MKIISDREAGARVRALRERAGDTQRDVADALGFNDVQTVSALEKGERRLAPEEMLALALRYNVGDGYFRDPFSSRALPRYSWTVTRPSAGVHALEQALWDWLSLYRELCLQGAGELPWILPRLPLDERSLESDCLDAGARIWKHLGCPVVPAKELGTILSSVGVLCLVLPEKVDVLAGAVRAGELNAVAVTPACPPGTRNAAIAKQLFHICTWDALPPPHIIGSAPLNRRFSSIDRLASAFARGLLLPSELVQSLNPPAFDTHEWILERARELGVPSLMLMARLGEEKRILRGMAIKNDALKKADDAAQEDELPTFGYDFLHVVENGRERGYVSEGKVLSRLGVGSDEYRRLLRAYGLGREGSVRS